MAKEIALLTLSYCIATLITLYTSIPESLVVMGILFVLFRTRKLTPNHFKKITPFVLVHISLFFIPPAAKVVEASSQLEGVLWKLVLILVISNMVVMGVTGATVQFILKGDKQSE